MMESIHNACYDDNEAVAYGVLQRPAMLPRRGSSACLETHGDDVIPPAAALWQQNSPATTRDKKKQQHRKLSQLTRLSRACVRLFQNSGNGEPSKSPNEIGSEGRNIFYRETSNGSKIAFRQKKMQMGFAVDSGRPSYADEDLGRTNTHADLSLRNLNRNSARTRNSTEAPNSFLHGYPEEDHVTSTKNQWKIHDNEEEAHASGPSPHSVPSSCNASYWQTPLPVDFSTSVPSLGSYRWSPVPSTQYSSPIKKMSQGLSTMRRARKLLSRSSSSMLTTASRSARHIDQMRRRGAEACNNCRQLSDPCDYCSSLWMNVQVDPRPSIVQSTRPSIGFQEPNISRFAFLRRTARLFLPFKRRRNAFRYTKKHNEDPKRNTETDRLDGQALSLYDDAQDELSYSSSYRTTDSSRRAQLGLPSTPEPVRSTRLPLSSAVSLPVIREASSLPAEDRIVGISSSDIKSIHRRLPPLDSLRRRLTINREMSDAMEVSRGGSPRAYHSQNTGYTGLRKHRSIEDARHKMLQASQRRAHADPFGSPMTKMVANVQISKQRSKNETSSLKRMASLYSITDRLGRQGSKSITTGASATQSSHIQRTSRFREELGESQQDLAVHKRHYGSMKLRKRKPYEKNGLDGSHDQQISLRKRNQGSVFVAEGTEDASDVWERALLNQRFLASGHNCLAPSISDHGRRSVSPGTNLASARNWPRLYRGLSTVSSANSAQSTNFASSTHNPRLSTVHDIPGEHRISKIASFRSTESWERYPSHTRAERTSSAGPADGVRIQDFGANAEADRDIDQTNQIRPSPPDIGFWERTTRLYKNNIGDLRRFHRGHRSSVSAGGAVAYPDLELLPKQEPVFVTITPKKRTTSGSTKEIPRRVSSVEALRPSSNPRFDESPECVRGLAIGSMPRSARAWSQVYQDCVQNPYEQPMVQSSDASSPNPNELQRARASTSVSLPSSLKSVRSFNSLNMRGKWDKCS